MPAPEWLILLVVIAVFGSFFVAISFVISRLGGWSDLAQHYRCGSIVPTTMTIRRLQSLFVGAARYSRIATIGLSQDGLYLATMFPFRLWHPPLLIPWHDVTIEWKTTYFFNARYLQLRVRLAPLSPLSVHSKRLTNLLSESAAQYMEMSQRQPKCT